MAERESSIIFGSFKGMGDLLWASPVIRSELDAGTDVHLLLFPNSPVLELCPLFDFGPRRNHLFVHTLPVGVLDVPRFLREVCGLSPEWIWISPHAPVADSSWKIPLAMRCLKSLFWRRARLVGAASERLSGLFDVQLSVDRRLPLPQRERSAYCLLRGLPQETELGEPRFIPELASRRNSLPLYDLVIHPGAGATNRVWPAGNYTALLRALPADWKIALLGLPAELAPLRKVLAVGSGVNVTFITGSLRESIETIASTQMLFAMSSGPMHFAEILGVPTVALFGQQSPQEVISPGSIVPIYRQSVPCQPCNRATCSQPQVYCLTNLDPVLVAEQIVALRTRLRRPELTRLFGTHALY